MHWATRWRHSALSVASSSASSQVVSRSFRSRLMMSIQFFLGVPAFSYSRYGVRWGRSRRVFHLVSKQPIECPEMPPCYGYAYSYSYLYSKVQLCTSWYAMGNAEHRRGESGSLALKLVSYWPKGRESPTENHQASKWVWTQGSALEKPVNWRNDTPHTQTK